MNPAERVVAEVIRQEREENRFRRRPTAIKPRVQARTGVGDDAFWRVLRAVNDEEDAR